MESREEKFKKHREQISMNLDDSEKQIENNVIVDNFADDLKTKKKNTLTMSIDQIIEAHDEYTTIIEQKELKEKLKLEKRERLLTRLKRVLIIIGIIFALMLIFGVLFFVILTILN